MISRLHTTIMLVVIMVTALVVTVSAQPGGCPQQLCRSDETWDVPSCSCICSITCPFPYKIQKLDDCTCSCNLLHECPLGTKKNPQTCQCDNCQACNQGSYMPTPGMCSCDTCPITDCNGRGIKFSDGINPCTCDCPLPWGGPTCNECHLDASTCAQSSSTFNSANCSCNACPACSNGGTITTSGNTCGCSDCNGSWGGPTCTTCQLNASTCALGQEFNPTTCSCTQCQTQCSSGLYFAEVGKCECRPCILQCTNGTVVSTNGDESTCNCECQGSTIWDGQSCGSSNCNKTQNDCTASQFLQTDSSSSTCQCIECSTINPNCISTGGVNTFSTESRSCHCQCPVGFKWDVDQCVVDTTTTPPSCAENFTLDLSLNKCVCSLACNDNYAPNNECTQCVPSTSHCSTTCRNGGQLQPDCSCQCQHPWIDAHCHVCSRASSCRYPSTLNVIPCTCDCRPNMIGEYCECVLEDVHLVLAGAPAFIIEAFANDPIAASTDTAIVQSIYDALVNAGSDFSPRDVVQIQSTLTVTRVELVEGVGVRGENNNQTYKQLVIYAHWVDGCTRQFDTYNQLSNLWKEFFEWLIDKSLTINDEVIPVDDTNIEAVNADDICALFEHPDASQCVETIQSKFKDAANSFISPLGIVIIVLSTFMISFIV